MSMSNHTRLAVFCWVAMVSCEVREEGSQKKSPTRQEEPAHPTPSTPPPEATKAPERTKEEEANAKIEQATVDFLQNGLAGIWSGKVTSSGQLTRWFVPGEETLASVAKIFEDQQRSLGKTLLSAEVVKIQLSTTLDAADVDFLIKTQLSPNPEECFAGTFHWLVQTDGTWLRNTQATLKKTPCLPSPTRP